MPVVRPLAILGAVVALVAGCDQRISVPYADAGEAPVIDATIDGLAVRALIDSGAAAHCSVSAELATRLHLQRLDGMSVTQQGISGDLEHGWIDSGSITLIVGPVTLTVDHPYVFTNPNAGVFPPVIIGYAGMKAMRLNFDYGHHRLSFGR